MRTRFQYLAISAAGIGAIVGCSLPARAQEESAPALETPEVIDRLFECRAIADDAARLACFDGAVGAVFAARESRELVIAEREQVEEAKRGLFGLNLPKIRLFGGGDDAQEASELTATLASATMMGNGLYIFELEDGARWVETEKGVGRKRYERGDTIVISKGALGSYKAKVNGQRAMRVRRIN